MLAQSILFLPVWHWIPIPCCVLLVSTEAKEIPPVPSPSAIVHIPISQSKILFSNFSSITKISKISKIAKFSKFRHYTYLCHRQVSVLKKRRKHILGSISSLMRGFHQILLGDQMHMLLSGMRMCQARKNDMCLLLSPSHFDHFDHFACHLDCTCPSWSLYSGRCVLSPSSTL